MKQHFDSWEEAGITLKRNTTYKTGCPRCREGKGSDLQIDPGRGYILCYRSSCEWSEGAWVGKRKKYQKIEKEEFVIPPPLNVTGLSDQTVQWFRDRSIYQTTLTLMGPAVTNCRNKWKVENQVKDCPTIMFNYFDLVNGISTRFNTKYRPMTHKDFRLVKKGKKIFWNKIQGFRESPDPKIGNAIIITEGEMDALSFIEQGYERVVSVPNGAGGGKNPHLEYMEDASELWDEIDFVYLALDDDEPGKILREEIARRVGFHKCKVVTYLGYKDANDLLVENPLEFDLSIDLAEEYPIPGYKQLSGSREKFMELVRGGLSPGDQISIDSFNNHLAFNPGHTTSITGIPKHGKSEYCDTIMLDLIRLHNWRFAVFTPENEPIEEHTQKLIQKVLGKKITPNTPQNQIDMFYDWLDDKIIYITPEEFGFVNTTNQVLSIAESLVRKFGINGLVIDAWNRLEFSNEYKDVPAELRKIERFNKRFGVHTLLVAHPTKMGGNKMPKMYDISGSANFMNMCSNGITIHRDQYDEEEVAIDPSLEGALKTETKVYIEKVKMARWGKPGTVKLNYDLNSGRHYDHGFHSSDSWIPVSVINKQVNIEEDFFEDEDDAPF